MREPAFPQFLALLNDVLTMLSHEICSCGCTKSFENILFKFDNRPHGRSSLERITIADAMRRPAATLHYWLPNVKLVSTRRGNGTMIKLHSLICCVSVQIHHLQRNLCKPFELIYLLSINHIEPSLWKHLELNDMAVCQHSFASSHSHAATISAYSILH